MDDLSKFLDFLYGGLEGYAYTPVKKRDGTWVQNFFRVPDEIEGLKSWIASASIEADVYLSPALFNQKSAKKECFKTTQVAWIEFDGQGDVNTEGLPPPSCVVQSSLPGHYHIYWRVGEQNRDTIESINRRLTYALEADSSGWDINQVLRPPTTHNYKRDLPVKLLGLPGASLPVEAFDKYPEPSIPIREFTNEDIPDYKTLTRRVPQDIMDMILKEIPPPKTRSTFLMHIGYKLAEINLKQEEIISLLLVADDRLQKFVGRSDRLIRLSEIAAIAVAKVGGIKAVPAYSLSELFNTEVQYEPVWGEAIHTTGLAIIAGAPSIGKTQFGISLGFHIALGMDYLNYDVASSLRVGFLSCEMGIPTLKKLLATKVTPFTEQQRRKLDENFLIFPVGHSMRKEEIEALVRDNGLQGLIIDSMSQVTRNLSNDDSMSDFFDWDTDLRERYGIFTTYLHHNRKANGDNKRPKKLDDVYGSYLIGSRPDTVLCLYRSDANRPIEYIGLKVRNGESGWVHNIERTSDLGFRLNKKAPTQALPGFTVIIDEDEDATDDNPNPGTNERANPGFEF